MSAQRVECLASPPCMHGCRCEDERVSSEQTAGPFIVRHEHSISPQSPGGVHVFGDVIHDLDDEPVEYGAAGVINDLIRQIEDGHTVEIKVVDHGRTTVAGRARRQWLIKPTHSHRYNEHGMRRVVPCRTVSVPRPPWTHEPEIASAEPEIASTPAGEEARFSSMAVWELYELRSVAEKFLRNSRKITDMAMGNSTVHAADAINPMVKEARSLIEKANQELARRSVDEG